MGLTESNSARPMHRYHPGLIISFLRHPSSGFKQISEKYPKSWLLPMLILSLTAVLYLIAAGYLKQQAGLTEAPVLPPDFDYYTPDQQAQYLQAAQSTQGVAFLYILPIFGSLFGIWIGWLVTGGMLHLVTTLFGGRGETSVSMNLVAWASLPLAIRNIVRFVYLLLGHKLIESTGLSGFAPLSDTNWSLFLTAILSLVDIYLIWHIILLVLGVRVTAGLTLKKSIGCVLIVVLVISGLQAFIQFLLVKVGNLSITRPFFF